VPIYSSKQEIILISVRERLPKPNQPCKVYVLDYLKKNFEGKKFKFITYSDGGYFWDDSETCLQDSEVTHWNPF
jgi:hypothetical protein